MAGYTIFTLAVMAVCALAAWKREEAREVFAASIFVVLLNTLVQLAISLHNALGGNLHPPASFIPDPIIDGLSMLLCAWSWTRRKVIWKLVLASCFLAQLGTHVAFWGSRDDGSVAQYNYTTTINLLYICIMLTLAVAGGRHLVAGLIGVRDRARHGGLRGSVYVGK